VLCLSHLPLPTRGSRVLWCTVGGAQALRARATATDRWARDGLFAILLFASTPNRVWADRMEGEFESDGSAKAPPNAV